MRSHFATNLLILVAAAAVVPLAIGLDAGTVGWIGLGAGCLATVVALVAFPLPGRGRGQRWLDVLTALLGGWTIVASRAFSGDTVRWLVFASACALFGLALAGLTAHEGRSRRALAERDSDRLTRLGPRDVADGNGRTLQGPARTRVPA
jgi:hypothetical protein